MSFHFDVEPFRKHCLLNGLDDIGLTLEHADAIRDFEAKRHAEHRGSSDPAISMKIAILPATASVRRSSRRRCACSTCCVATARARNGNGADRRRRLRRRRHPLPESTLALARAADAVLMGAVGGPQYDALPRALRPEQGILGIRKALQLFANLRPALLYPELVGASSMRPEVVSGLDLMIIRELTGDIYFGQPRGRRTNAPASSRLRHDALWRAGDSAHRRIGFEPRASEGRSSARSTRRTCSTRASCGARR
jgi:hypothetical protein